MDGDMSATAYTAAVNRPTPPRFAFSMREGFLATLAAASLIAAVVLSRRVATLRDEVDRYRAEVGYLRPGDADSIAAVRVPWDEPLQFRYRVRVPDEGRYRLTYGTTWSAGKARPDWMSAVPLPPGESRVTVRVLEDPRDRRWKVAAIVATPEGTRRSGTTLPADQERIFRDTAERLSSGVEFTTVTGTAGQSIRLMDLRWLVGEGALMLYGSAPPRDDQIGLFAEVQPDSGPM